MNSKIFLFLCIEFPLRNNLKKFRTLILINLMSIDYSKYFVYNSRWPLELVCDSDIGFYREKREQEVHREWFASWGIAPKLLVSEPLFGSLTNVTSYKSESKYCVLPHNFPIEKYKKSLV